ncbi:TPA_asm: hypothetical protein G0B27_22995 [Salmonella enterica subsp. indica]|uniref:Uncharacterized protein n=1 Tax=Salmonella enterica TaxID=28901 RepID=A0A701ZHC1_SALER|nr:hypothetical protein [Salmonella enterica subsp. indica serovar 11:b:e,n,x]HAC6576994.1 hypothetical protein [Salmonella enterica subsp. indica]
MVYEHINNDIDASDWGEHILDLLGEEILYCKYYYSVSGQYADLLTKKDIDNETITSRIRVFKNYDFENNRANVIMVKACCNWKDYESLAEELFHCVKFFTLINDSKWHLAEELKSINLDVPANHSFYYPASWLYSERYNNEKMSYYSLSLKKENKTPGVIDGYFLCHDATIDKEIICNLINEKLKDNKYSAEKIRLNEERDIFNKNISELWSSMVEVNNEQNRNELIVYAGRIEGAWFYLIGTSVAKEINFMSWAAVKRSMDIIINSLNNYHLSYEDNFYE